MGSSSSVDYCHSCLSNTLISPATVVLPQYPRLRRIKRSEDFDEASSFASSHIVNNPNTDLNIIEYGEELDAQILRESSPIEISPQLWMTSEQQVTVGTQKSPLCLEIEPIMNQRK